MSMNSATRLRALTDPAGRSPCSPGSWPWLDRPPRPASSPPPPCPRQFNWYYNGHWSNGQLGHGEAAIAHSGLSALLQPDGYSSVFYTGGAGQIYAWVFSTTTSWGNKVLGVPAGGSPAAPRTAAGRRPRPAAPYRRRFSLTGSRISTTSARTAGSTPGGGTRAPGTTTSCRRQGCPAPEPLRRRQTSGAARAEPVAYANDSAGRCQWRRVTQVAATGGRGTSARPRPRRRRGQPQPAGQGLAGRCRQPCPPAAPPTSIGPPRGVPASSA